MRVGSAQPEGLSPEEAARRLLEQGPNELAPEKRVPAWRRFLEQFRGALVLLLLGACGISALLGHWVDALAILAILVLNALVGFVQEHRADHALGALRSMTAPRARVVRSGHLVDIPAREVVEGDVLVLEAGDVVAADARLVEAHSLSANEATLTGESSSVQKRMAVAEAPGPLAERHGEIFAGTSIAAGTGRAEVVATGTHTQLGRIAELLASTSDEVTPLQRRLEEVGRRLLVLCLIVVAAVLAMGLVRGEEPIVLLLSAVSLAVAAVPEGLAAVVTIALAVGVQRMAERNVLVRRLLAVETLGSTTLICTDKTGTLTTGVMRVREIWGADHLRVLHTAAANCDARLAEGGTTTGDSTEVALVLAAAERGIRVEDIERENPRVHVLPFDPGRRRMSILRADGVLYVKGAFESVAAVCRQVPAGAEAAQAEMAALGLRVLAVALGRESEERELELLGILGIADPPRTEAIEAVAVARRAGIRTVMITGDHPRTATAIAREMGILLPGEDPAEIVHARATPEQKLELVRSWKERGAIVAMTGDGVNDAPALREAHVGIAMGRTGTDVTRQAADIVLADDNFASVVAAIREGRGVYENIRKTLVYLLAGNCSELVVMLGAAVVGLPLPLLATQLLWINLVTDGLPALALVMDPADPRLLERPPRPPSEPILGRRQWRRVLVTGALEATLALGLFAWALSHRSLAEARTLVFTVLVFAEVLRAFAARSEDLHHFQVGAFTNLRLLAAVGLTVLLHLGLLEIPALRSVFGLAPLGLADLALAFAVGLVPVTVLEVAKLVPFRPRAGHDRSARK